jgi:outer membrane protein assembly factor BamB
MPARRGIAAALLALAVLAACDRGDQILPGERIPVRPDPTAEAEAGPSRARAIGLPPPRVNAAWTHQNGAAGGRPAHPALAPVPQLRWAADIGAGDARRARILTAPIVSGGLVFTIDAAGQMTAVVAGDGRVAWRRSLVPPAARPDSGPGGGIAVAGGVLYVTTGFGEVLALSPETGQPFWRVTLEAPIRAAPAVRDGRVIAVLRNDTAFALDARTGATLWRVQGTGGTGLLGGAAPAAEGPLVVVPFASGEVLGVLARNGLTVWGTAVTGGRREFVRNSITDVSGAPVIDGEAVYASNQAGRTIRVDRLTGERAWTIQEGSYGPAWPVGGSVFLLSDIGMLVRADAATGEIVWSVQLPELFPNPGFFGRGQPFRAVSHYGPVLAGGRLWVASADGLLRAFRPSDGALLAELALPGGAAAPPAVAGGVMYVVSRDGRLLAYQ